MYKGVKTSVVYIIVVMVFLAGCSDRCASPIEGNPLAVIRTNMGRIVVELYEDRTPNTVANFVRLVNDGFYDGLLFHRVIDDFIIQGGIVQPDGTQRVSPYGPIGLEIHPDATHVDGAVAMTWAVNPNNATSGFYICDGPQVRLDGQYAVFGIVVDGMDVVRHIASVPTTTKNGHYHNWPIDDVTITTVTITHCVPRREAAAR